MATYEINLPRIAEALIVRGVRVRVIADGKDLRDSDAQIRFPRMQLLLEKMLRGQDGTLNTADDVHLFSESPILAVDNPGLRAGADLPAAFYDLLAFRAQVGGQPLSGRLVAGGERKSTGDFFASRPKMYNKFAIIDGAWVFTGSWNFTLLRYK